MTTANETGEHTLWGCREVEGCEMRCTSCRPAMLVQPTDAAQLTPDEIEKLVRHPAGTITVCPWFA